MTVASPGCYTINTFLQVRKSCGIKDAYGASGADFLSAHDTSEGINAPCGFRAEPRCVLHGMRTHSSGVLSVIGRDSAPMWLCPWPVCLRAGLTAPGITFSPGAGLKSLWILPWLVWLSGLSIDL